jgi:drug/metabolite transporter (DMT)-like permease
MHRSRQIQELGWIAGCFAYGGGVALTAALRLVEASSATAMSYLTVVWGLILGYFFFSEVMCLLLCMN